MRGRISWTAVVVGLTTGLPIAMGLPAFPGAEGFGSQAVGGRSGDVYHVTNLNNSGAGSLRYGIEGGVRPRTIVFDVGGTINLTSRITINNGRLTIAGQTAPGGGILIKNAITKVSGTSHVVLRHLRFRLGTGSDEEGEPLWISDCQNVIVDHCSVSWGTDECLSVTNDCHNITISNCIIAEGLRSGHQYGSLVNTEHSGGGSLTFHRNSYINQLGRTPRAASQNGQPMVFDFVNNVIYNWGTGGDWGTWATTTSNEYAQWNFVNNYHIAGPNTVRSNIFQPEYNKYALNCGDGADRIYLSGSRIDHDRDSNTMHDGVSVSWSNTRGSCEQMSTPFDIPAWAQVSALSADDALDVTVADCGAVPWKRDEVDERLISELQTFGGSIKTVEPGWPVIAGGTNPVDTDGDGMWDAWEIANGTNPNVWDSNGDTDGDGYTNLEAFLSQLPPIEIPFIGLSTHAIQRTVDLGQVPAGAVFTITNAGAGTLQYRVETDRDWLSVMPLTGSSAGEPTTVTVSFGPDPLPLGTHSATILVVDNGSFPSASNSPQSVIVTVKVDTVLPDFDSDGDVDQADFGFLQNCLTDGGAGLDPGCEPADMDGDFRVDSNDLGVFLQCLSGSGEIADAACDDATE